jgi:hypothetical protein
MSKIKNIYKKIELEATYIGKDEIAGFEVHKRYCLTLTLQNNGKILIDDRCKQHISCLYSDIMAFFKDWNNILHYYYKNNK